MPNSMTGGFVSLLVTSFLAFILTAAGLFAALASGWAARISMDNPNERSLHTIPVPRIAGLVMVPSVLISWYLTLPIERSMTLIAALSGALVIISLFDDRYGLPVGLRLAVHLGVVSIFIYTLAPVGLWMGILLIIMLSWAINLYNFMDGANGLAGGMAVFGFGTYGVVAAMADPFLAGASFAVAGAGIAFLFFNFNPARVFLGDAGSIPLGFLAGAIGYAGYIRGVWPMWLPIFVFSPFFVDATITLLRRFFRGDRIWRAHRDHFYQLLIRMGWSHRRLALMEYGVMCLVSLSALFILWEPRSQWPLLTIWALIYAILAFLITRKWRVNGIQSSNTPSHSS